MGSGYIWFNNIGWAEVLCLQLCTGRQCMIIHDDCSGKRSSILYRTVWWIPGLKAFQVQLEGYWVFIVTMVTRHSVKQQPAVKGFH